MLCCGMRMRGAFVADHGKDDKKANSKLTHLLDGTISKDSTDAITGKQLYSLSDNVAKSFGDGAGYDAEGNWKTPTFKVKTVKDNGESEEQEYKNVAAAFEGVGASFTNIKKDITNQINHLQSEDSAVVHYDKKDEGETDYASITLGGKDKTSTALRNVADGKIAKDSHDAITGGQINKIGEDITKYLGGESSFKDGALTGPSYNLSDVSKDGQITDKSFTDVGKAFEGLDSNIKNVNDRIKEVSEGVAQDSLSWSKGDGAFSAQHGSGDTKANSKIKFLSAGDVSANSTEAINGSQVYSLSDQFAKYLDVNAGYDAKGEWKAPSFTVNAVKDDGVTIEEKKYDTVAEALSDVGNSFTNIKKDITNVVSDSLVKWDEEQQVVKIGAEKHGNKITISDQDSKDRILSGVKDAEHSNEAVNKGQLDDNVTKLSDEIADVRSVAVFYDEEAEPKGGNPLIRSARKVNKTSVTFGDPKTGTVALHNVGNGSISSESHDAINGSQLFETNKNVATYLGGGAKYENGAWVAPSFKVKTVNEDGSKVEETSYDNVAAAFEGVGSSFTNIHKELKNEISQVVGNSLVKQDDAGLITIGKEVAGSEINVANKTGEERTLSGVKAATKDNEAVNKKQLEEHLKDLSSSLQSDESAVVHYDKTGDKTDYTSVTLGKGKDSAPVGLHNVADGQIAESSHDAINGGQINKIGEDIAKYLGGESSFKDGTLTGPSYKLSEVTKDGQVTDKSFTDVGKAFEGLDSNIKNVNDRIKEVSEGVAQDSLSWSKGDGAFSAQHGSGDTKANSKIKFLSAGDVSANSTEAINGSQVYSLSDQFAKYLDVNAGYDAKGEWKAPSFTVNAVKDDGVTIEEKKYDTVAEALSDVGNSFTNIKKDITNVVSDSLVKWDEEQQVVKIGAEKHGNKITISDQDSKDRILSGVKDAEHSNEAVNKGQLDDNVTKLSDEIADVRSVAVFYDEEAEPKGGNPLIRSARKVNKTSVTFGDPKTGTVALHNVGNGSISSESHDAINGSQLFETNKNVATYLGGGAKYENGAWVAPSFKVKTVNEDGSKVEETSYDNVAAAFEGVGSSFTNIHKELKNEISQVVGNSLVKQDDAGLITIGKEVAGSEINVANKTGEERTLSGVKAATKDNEAVNKKQLEEHLKDLSSSLQSDESAVVHYDKTGDKTDYTSVTLGKGKDSAPVGLHNVADGQIAESSHDAINGGQINKIGEDIAKYLGGESSFKDGTLTGPSYKLSEVTKDGQVTDKSFTDVGKAFEGLDSNIKNVNDRIKEVSEGVAQDSLSWSKSDGAFVALHGEKEGEKVNSKITSLAAGSIASGSSDAVTGGQLYTLNQTLATYLGGGAGYNEEGKWNGPTFKVKSYNEDGEEVEEERGSVSEAFDLVNQSFTDLHKEVNSKINQVLGDSLVKQDETSKLINIGKEVEGSEINIANKTGAYRTLSGLKKAEKGDEAVNKTQLDEETEARTAAINKVNSTAVFYDIIEDEDSGDSRQRSPGLSKRSVTFGDADAVALRNVAAGKIEKDSTEAVTGGQVHTLTHDVSKILGGGVGFENGQLSKDKFTVQAFNSEKNAVEGTSYDSVADAFEGVGKSFTNVVTSFNKKVDNITESVQGDALLWDDKAKAFVALHGKGDARANSKITSLAAGDITSGSTDAVNGSQLHSLGEEVSKSLGGEASYKDGAWSAPNFKIKIVKEDGQEEDKSYPDVAAAFAGVGSSFTNIHKELKNEISQVVSDSLVKQDKESKVIKIGAEKGGTSINIANSGDAARALSGVKAGSLTKESTDAINGSQLYSLNQTLASYFGGGAKYENGAWVAPSFKVKTVNEDGSKVEEKSYDDVAKAFASVGNSFSNLHQELKNEISQVVGDSLVKQDEKTHVIAVGGEKSGTKVTLANVDNAARALLGVKSGELSETSTEAVNGSQLFATNEHVSSVSKDLEIAATDIAKTLGGGAEYKEGKWVSPSFKVKTINEDGEAGEEAYASVSAAFEGVGSSFTNIKNELKNEISQVVSDNLVKFDEKSRVIKIGSEKDGSSITLGNSEGMARSLSGVKSGVVSEESTDAINGSQLYTLNQTLATYFGGGAKYENGTWIAPKFVVKTVNKEGDAVEETSYDNVSAAFAGVGTSFENLQKKVTESNTQVTENIKQNALLWSDSDKAFVAQHGEKEGAKTNSKIKYLSNGEISSSSSDAVAGNQLHALGEEVSRTLGGEAKYENGTWTSPKFTVKTVNKESNAVEETSYDDVVAAFAGVGTSFENLQKKVTESNTQVTENIKQNALLWSDSDKAFVAQHGEGDAKTNSKIKHLSNGEISASSSDAVAGNQLHALGEEVSKTLGGNAKYENGTWTSPKFTVKTVRKESDAVEETSYDDVAAAFAGVGTSFENLQKKVTESNTQVTENIKQNALLWSDSDKAFVAQHGEGDAKTNSKITHLSDGKIASGSSDAVTGGQLYSMNEQLASYLGGGSGYDEKGKWTAPNFKVKTVKEDGKEEDKSYGNVAAAFEGVGSSFTNIKNDLSNQINNAITNVKGESLVKWDEETQHINIGGEKDDATINIADKNKNNRILSGVKAAENDNEAVNKGQLDQGIEDVRSVAVLYDEEVEPKGVNPLIRTARKVNKNSVTFGDPKTGTVALHNVGNGIVSSDSHDAINGSQLFETNKTVASYLGGGAQYEEGKWTGPTFKVKTFKEDGKEVEEERGSVSDAFDLVNQSFTDLHNEVNSKINQVVSDNLVKFDEKTNLIRVGGEKDGASISIADKGSKDRRLSGLKAAENDNEAVNKGQLDESLNDLSNKLQSEDSAVVLYDKTEGENSTTNYASVTFGKGKDRSPVGLHNVADGKIGEGSHDAINGSQLYTLGNGLAHSLGGEAKYENGTWIAPKFVVKTVNKEGDAVEEASYDDVAAAFAGVGTSFENLQKKVTESNTQVTENIKQNALLWSDSDKAFVAQHGEGDAKTNSKIKHLADGNITSGSTDAINGSQLFETNDKVATYLGGGASYKDGAWTDPSFKVKIVNEDGSKVEEKSYDDVAAAFAGVGSSFTNIHKELKNEINQVVSDSLVKQDKESKVIKIGAEKGGTSINIANSGDAARALSGVKAGSLTKESTDAINGSQLYSLNQTLASYFGGGAKYENGAWVAPSFKVKTVNEDGSKVEEKSYDDVAKAFASVGNSFSNLHQELKNEISQVVGDSLVKQDEKTHVIAVGGEKSGTKVTLANVDNAARALLGVKSGELSETSTEAVNGSQLFATNEHVSSVSKDLEIAATDIAKTLGGGAEYKEGKWVSPSFKVKTINEDGEAGEEAYASVSAAFEGVGSSFTNIKNELKNEISQVVSDNLVKFDEKSRVIKIGSEKDGSSITLANSEGMARSLSGVKSGVVSEESTDAINGSQLYTLNQTLATYFGGGAKYENGTWVAPSFKVKTVNEDGSKVEETSYDNVSEAFAGVGTSFENLHQELKNEINQVAGDSLVKQDEKTHVISVGGEKSGTEVTLANIDGAARTLSGVKAGLLSEGSMEAINGSQLYSMSNALASYFGGGAKYENGEWKVPAFKVTGFKSDGSSDDEKSYNDVASAFEGINGSMSTINNRISDVEKTVTSNGLNWNDEVGAYDGKHNGSSSKISNVADGLIEEGSQDVVNGGQLWQTNDRVSKVESKVDSIDQQVKDIATSTDGAVKYDKDEAGHKTNKVTLVGGDESDPVLIDNVADGKIESGSKEAINGGQLHDYTDQQMKIVLDDAKKYTDEHLKDMVNNGVDEAKSYTDIKFETLNYAIEDVRKEARQAAAIGLAVSNLRYYDIPGSVSISFGSGLWRSQSAFAVGAGYTSEDGNIRSNVSITSAGGHWGIGAGITLRLR